jgi:multidrug efflux pump subunit AcrA (membrane-fusion protein)
VLLALVLLNGVELAGVALVGPGFWIGFSVSCTVLLAYLAYLRRRAVAAARQQRIRARRAAWVAAEQAAVRREQARLVAQRQAATRRAASDREDARRAAARDAGDYVERYSPRRTTP